MTVPRNRTWGVSLAWHGAVVWVVCLALSVGAAGAEAGIEEAEEVLALSGFRGGLLVHLGCGDGEGTAALAAGTGRVVHGLERDPARVAAARRTLQAKGVYGTVSVDCLEGSRLPYIDNLVNLVVAEDLGGIAQDELLRVLCPGGVACVRENGQWRRLVKSRPAAIDDWSHYLYNASGNAVSQDTVVGPPRRIQWVDGPLYSRHHDRMSSVSAVVSAGGRVFTIFDEGTPASILAPPRWVLSARDAFNGTVLWKRPMGPWHTHLWPLKSGPAQLPRRLVASETRVYVTLQLGGPLTALDAATGEVVETYAETSGTEEILLDEGVLFVLRDPRGTVREYADLQVIGKAVREPFYDEEPRQVAALDAATGKPLWSVSLGVLPGTLAAGAAGLFLHDGECVVSLDRGTGRERWRSEPVTRQPGLRSMYMPTLVLYRDVVLFSGRGRPAAGAAGGRHQMTALSASTGRILWQADHPPSGYQSPADILVAGGRVWSGETTTGSGVFTGRDPWTGEVQAEFGPDVDVFWFHHRCYRGKATENYLLMSRSGVEFVDFRKQQWLVNHWVRGACLYGIMPANGLLYAPQHPCACYLETKLSGFHALAPAAPGPRVPPETASQRQRLERGPAYDSPALPRQDGTAPAGNDWPTYRADAGRSGRAGTQVAADVRPRWRTDLGGRLRSPVIAAGTVFVARPDTHTLHALDAADGHTRWTVTVGGRIDSPPTVYAGRVLFGAADGWVYCLRADDGALAWRFLAAPMDQRHLAFGQVQSVWPVHGSVLVQEGAVWAVAGRSVFLDEGLRLWRLDPIRGDVLSETVLDNRAPGTGEDLHAYVSWLNMPVGLPDILSCDGRTVYMRSQGFSLDGTPHAAEAFPRAGEGHGGANFAPPPNQNEARAHLFSPTGFLDDSWWHRSYWLYGSRFYSGWCAYYLSGKVVPAGRILVYDDSQVYGYGRKPQYYRWTTPIEHHLFAAPKTMPPPMSELPGQAARRGADAADASLPGVQVPRSASLDPTAKALTVEAWIRAEEGDGVVLAHGGHSQGYALFLDRGRPKFAVRSGGTLGTVSAGGSVVGGWRHVAGVLTAVPELEVYVDGRLAGKAPAPGFVGANPVEGVDIGSDSQTAVGEYGGSTGFQGAMDDVRLVHRALTPAQIAARAAGDDPAEARADLALALAFEDGTATDRSGHGNHGQVRKATSVEGRHGAALYFPGGGAGPRALVRHSWTVDLPFMPRGMVLAKDVLFVAGPPDLVDEEAAARTLGDEATRQSLSEHAAALEGRRGGMLRAVAAQDGRTLAEQPIEAPCVFDGMAAAAECLFLVDVRGQVLCFGRE
ncbi:MAG: PQQ-binding-like beta-propeller repeat protein [Lentisphaeria bacterium]|nr:PQQ-binding-like beta-propeller repeat protein [Lentisphaeria bacterium]